jgi:hypothetical protein
MEGRGEDEAKSAVEEWAKGGAEVECEGDGQ